MNVKVTSIQKCFMDGTIYLYSERYHRIEYPDGTVEESCERLSEIRKEIPEFEQEMKVRKVQVSESEMALV